MPTRKKIGLIGAGNIGGELARLCANKELGDVYLFDIPAKENFAKGKALDLEQNGAILGYDSHVRGTSNWADLEGADVLIVTAGIPRKPGMSRDDLIATNANVVKSVGENIKKYAPDAFVIVITNPLDVMVWAMQKVTGFAPAKVVGMAGVLDSARFRYFLAEEFKVSVEDVTAFVLGGHGDTMVPLPRYSTCAGIPITELLPKETVDQIVTRTANGGAEIVSLLKTGSAYYAPSSAAVEMVEAIVKDKKKILPCAVLLEGEYGINNLFVGVPVKIGAGGIEEIIQINLTTEERAALQKSAGAVQELVDKLNL